MRLALRAAGLLNGLKGGNVVADALTGRIPLELSAPNVSDRSDRR